MALLYCLGLHFLFKRKLRITKNEYLFLYSKFSYLKMRVQILLFYNYRCVLLLFNIFCPL